VCGVSLCVCVWCVCGVYMVLWCVFLCGCVGMCGVYVCVLASCVCE